jgi:catechol 2,3-dioxygenase-like lactoylglutathione lyase family enzyme
MSVDLFAGIRVADYTAARDWYERLLGSEPSFVAHETECVWELGEHRFLFIEEDAERAGYAGHTIFVDDLEAVVEDIAVRGIEPAKRESYGNGVRKATYRDSDGNEIGFGGAPLEGSAD